MFWEQGNNIQVTSKPISIADIIKFNKDRIEGLKKVCKTDGNFDSFEDVLQQANNMLKGLNTTDINCAIICNENIQKFSN